ncbi:MAG: tyrosine-type recombinase/integrase [Pseudomonadota bacterium]|nr:tyrosine-type recombinase/integrase [Pseudomonadota bacterium]
MPRLTHHGLRKSCTTVLIEAGLDPKSVSDRLGHATVAMTLDIYTKVNAGRRQEVADVMGAILRGEETG